MGLYIEGTDEWKKNFMKNNIRESVISPLPLPFPPPEGLIQVVLAHRAFGYALGVLFSRKEVNRWTRKAVAPEWFAYVDRKVVADLCPTLPDFERDAEAGMC